jgi:hypothetical protein
MSSAVYWGHVEEDKHSGSIQYLVKEPKEMADRDRMCFYNTMSFRF